MGSMALDFAGLRPVFGARRRTGSPHRPTARAASAAPAARAASRRRAE